MRKNIICLALAFAWVVGFTAAKVQARGGHREAPRSGGERVESNPRAGDERQHGEVKKQTSTQNRTPANAVKRPNTVQNNASQIHPHYAPQNKPFSSGWYANHPQAWQASHSFAGNWASAGLGAATAWMGMSAVAGDGDTYADGTIQTGDDDSGDDNNQPAQADQSQPVQTDQSQPVQNYQPQPAVATQLAASGSEVADESSWLPLGVYALKDGNQTEATAMLQLSVNKQGVLRGSYYDVVSDQGQAIQGGVDKKTRGVAWKVGSNGPVIFETALANLTQASGPVSLHFANGQTRQWSLTRLENPAPTK
jgi:hypothetical protein